MIMLGKRIEWDVFGFRNEKETLKYAGARTVLHGINFGKLRIEID